MVNYLFATKVPYYEMENCKFVPWSWLGPIESLLRDSDFNKLPEMEFRPDIDMECPRKIAQDWNKIRDHVLKKACESKKE